MSKQAMSLFSTLIFFCFVKKIARIFLMRRADGSWEMDKSFYTMDFAML